MKRIVVLGSLNIDFVQQIARIPQPGETLKGGDLETFVGGKGANQACAAALLGERAEMAGMVGRDAFGPRLVDALRQAGVNTESVEEVDGASGSASIFVLPDGENAIAIAPGANAKVTLKFALERTNGLQSGDFLLCQLETPLDAVEGALRAAYKRGVTTILDPAPAAELPDALLRHVMVLTPNQTEAALLAGDARVSDDEEAAQRYARKLRTRGARTVIVKLGARGCLLAEEDGMRVVPGFRVRAVDTTAAGDTFNGALAAGLAEGLGMGAAARFANAAAALSVTKPGAISSMPKRADVDGFLAAQPDA